MGETLVEGGFIVAQEGVCSAWHEFYGVNPMQEISYYVCNIL